MEETDGQRDEQIDGQRDRWVGRRTERRKKGRQGMRE